MIGEIYLSSNHLASGSVLYTPVVYARFHAGRARHGLAPTRSGQTLGPAKRSMCPNVGATHRVALAHSCQHARSWPRQTNREAVPRGDGHRRLGRGNASPLRGPAKRPMCPNVGATHRVALDHSCQHARSWLRQTNREAVPRGGGRSPMRARQCLAPTRSGQTLHVSQRRGDPPGRPRSFMPTRSFMAATNKSRGSAPGRWASPIRARQCLAPTRSGQTLHVSQRRGDPPGRPRSFMPTRSFMAATNKSRGNASGWWATPDEGEACLAPTRSGQTPHVSQRRGDPPGRPRSFMPTRSFMAGTNKSRGSAPGRWATRDEGEAWPRPYAVRTNAPCVPT